MRVIFAGMGGTGTFAVRPFLMYLASTRKTDIEVIIIDGDAYDVGNTERQDFDPALVGENKALAKAHEMSEIFPNIPINAVDDYLNEENMDYYIADGDVVMLAVDCPRTRSLVDEIAQTLDNILIISMGNEMVDGDIQVSCRVNGENLSPSIREDHPEIADAKNRTRSEMSCEEMAATPSGGQLIFANLQSAVMGVSSAWKFLKETEFLTQQKPVEYRGAYFDVESMKVRPVKNRLFGSFPSVSIEREVSDGIQEQ